MQRFILLFLLLIVFQSCQNKVDFEASDAVFKTGDDLAWADKNYIDTSWRKERGHTQQKVFWARYHVKLNHVKKPNDHLALQIHSFGAFEVYWDGVRIGENGQPALTSRSEIPGVHTSNYLLPDSLSHVGKHILALRATQYFNSNLQRGSSLTIAHYAGLIKEPLIISSIMNLMNGAFLVVALYYLFLYLNSTKKRSATIIFSLSCFLFFALLMMEYIKFYIDIPYPYFYTRLEIIGGLTFAIALLIPLYFSTQFNFKRKRWLIMPLILVLLFIYIANYHEYDFTAKLFSGTMWLAAMIVVLDAVFRKEKGGIIVLFGLVVSMIINNFIYYDFGVFICFTIIVLCMLYLHAIKTREHEKAHQSSLLLSARLKLELLKKNIQPHFIKNTLTSLIDWVEESPKEGVVFIKALADEFDILNEIAEATLIPISSEISLCKAHLSVMQFRKEVHYLWNEKNIDPLDTIPPAIIHTALENGITHSLPLPDGSIHFELSFKRTKTCKEYMLLITAKNRPPSTHQKKSTGFQYIVARLTESYGEGWGFESNEIPTGWCTKITIHHKS